MKFKPSIREIVFGLEDGIVSTLGVVIGIAVGTNNRVVVILSGLVVIFVESLSMATGAYLSNKTELEIQLSHDKKAFWRRFSHPHNLNQPIFDSFYMGLAYMLGGTIVLFSFFQFPPLVAIIPTIIISFLSLFIAGVIKGKLVQVNPLRSGLEMMLVSAAAALIGFLVGKFASLMLA